LIGIFREQSSSQAMAEDKEGGLLSFTGKELTGNPCVKEVYLGG